MSLAKNSISPFVRGKYISHEIDLYTCTYTSSSRHHEQTLPRASIHRARVYSNYSYKYRRDSDRIFDALVGRSWASLMTYVDVLSCTRIVHPKLDPVLHTEAETYRCTFLLGQTTANYFLPSSSIVSHSTSIERSYLYLSRDEDVWSILVLADHIVPIRYVSHLRHPRSINSHCLDRPNCSSRDIVLLLLLLFIISFVLLFLLSKSSTFLVQIASKNEAITQVKWERNKYHCVRQTSTQWRSEFCTTLWVMSTFDQQQSHDEDTREHGRQLYDYQHIDQSAFAVQFLSFIRRIWFHIQRD